MATLQMNTELKFIPVVDKFVVLTEGSMADLKSLMNTIANQHSAKNQLVITLGFGFNPNADASDTGVRASSALAKYLALNPELIDSLKAKGVHFLAYDKNTGKNKIISDFCGNFRLESIACGLGAPGIDVVRCFTF
jgi:hypothetical protein